MEIEIYSLKDECYYMIEGEILSQTLFSTEECKAEAPFNAEYIKKAYKVEFKITDEYPNRIIHIFRCTASWKGSSGVFQEYFVGR